MTKFFLKIFDILIGHRKAVYISTCLVLLGCAVLALRMHYDEDISAFIPLDRQTAKYSEVFNNMGGQNKIAVIFRGTDDVSLLEEAMDAFGESVAERDTCKLVQNLQVRVDETVMMDILRSVWSVYPLMMTDADYQHLDSVMAADRYLDDQMDRNRQMLMLPTGSIVAQSLPYDPLHMSTGVANRLRDLNINNEYQMVDGYLFKDGAGIVLLESPFGISESRNNQQLQDLLDACILDVRSVYPSLSMSAIGAPLIAVTNANQIKADSYLAVGLAVVLILLILFYSFRKVGNLLWIGVSVFAGWLFALGVISLIHDSISLIVIGIGSVIIGIAVNYPLHFIDHLKHESNMREALKEMVPPLLVGNITTVSAFLCLVLLDAQAMRDLGLFGSLVLVGTILFVLVCLPVFLNPEKVKGHSNQPRLFERFRFSPGRRMKRVVLWSVVGLTLLLGYFSTDTSFDSNMQNINYMLPEQREDLKFLSSSLQSSNDSLSTLYAVAEGATLDIALSRNEQMVDSIAGRTGVNRVVGIAGMMLSDSLSVRQMKRWTDFWDSKPTLIKDLERAANASGFSSGAFSPFEAMVYRPQSVIDNSSYRQSFMDLIGHQFVMHDENGYKIVNFVLVDKERANQIKTDMASVLPSDCFVFSQFDVSNHLAVMLSDSFNYIGFVCGFVVFLFLWLSFGSIELSLLAFLPLAVSWIWILGIMQILGLQFNIVNIILATFIFGQGDDYTIFITEGLMYEYTTGRKRLARYKSSVALSAIIMFIGIGTLIFSKHPAMRSLAEVVIIGMITVVVMAYYLPPLVFRWLTEKHGKRREYPVTLYRLAASVFSFSFFLCGMFFVLVPYTLLIHRPLRKVWAGGEQFYHKLLQRVSHFVIRRVPGVKFREMNREGETFDKPAVIICNHQSHLDVMCIMQLSPKIIILTNDWVWNNPYYGLVIHTAEFRPVSNGFDRNFPYLQDLVRRGYSIVVFPEGTRTPDGEIGRFHKGAFTLAKALGVDVLPMFIHGLYDVLPKHDFMLRKGTITLEVGKRVTADSMKDVDDRSIKRSMHRFYVAHYAEMRAQLETPEYQAPYIAYKNKYKIKEV